jgi:hypothetical protein
LGFHWHVYGFTLWAEENMIRPPWPPTEPYVVIDLGTYWLWLGGDGVAPSNREADKRKLALQQAALAANFDRIGVESTVDLNTKYF